MIFSQPSQTASKESLACRVAAVDRAMAVFIALPMSLLILPSVTHAQQWVLQPEIEVAAQYIDNPRLQENGLIEDISGGLLDVAAALYRNTETSSFLIRPAAAVYRYAGDTDEDSEAYFFDVNGEKLGQRSTWYFTGNFRQQQVFRGETTSSEIDEGIDDSVQTGTGRTFERRQRDMWRLRPGFTLDFTERTALKVELNYLDVRYDTQALGEAIDYTDGGADASIVRTLSEGSFLEFGVFASIYEPDAVTSRDTESTGVRLRYEKEVSNVSTFFVDLGGQDSKIESTLVPGSDISETSFLWNLGYRREWERTRWIFDVGHNVTPSGSGVMVERDLYRAIMQHQLKPRWSTEFSAAVMNTESLGGETLIANNERDYWQGRAGLAWQMTMNWTIEGLYSYTHQDFADIDGDAQEHEVRLSLIYRPPLPTQ